MDAGGSLYIEGANVGTGSNDLLYPYLGLSNHSSSIEGYTLIESVNGAQGTPMEGLSLNYMYGSNADYGIDELDVIDGVPFLMSQDEAVRTIYFDSDAYRAVTSSTFFGSMVDGNTTKADVMGIYLDFLNGNPVPNISALQTELDFGLQFAGYPESEWINLINTGIEILEITEITIEGEVYSYEGPSIIELEPMEMVNLEIIQYASITGLYEGVLTIASNDPDTPDFEIPLSGACVQPPIICVEPENIEVSLTAGETFDEIITIGNTGGYDLGFSAVLEEGSRDVNWLEMDHHFNLLAPGVEDDIILTFNTEFLDEDQYNAEIVIYHDDPGQDEIIIPVTLYISYVSAENNLIGSQVTLSQNYPNPFNPSTTISFTTDEVSSSTILSVYNVKGELVKTLINDVLTAGTHSVIWNGKDDTEKYQSSGMYFYRLQNADKSITRKMILMK